MSHSSLYSIPSYLRVILVSVLRVISIFVVESLVVSAILSFAGNPAFLSVLGAHLLFNMKEAGAKGLNQGTNYGSRVIVSDIDFAAAPPVATTESSNEETNSEEFDLEIA